MKIKLFTETYTDEEIVKDKVLNSLTPIVMMLDLIGRTEFESKEAANKIKAASNRLTSRDDLSWFIAELDKALDLINTSSNQKLQKISTKFKEIILHLIEWTGQ